MTEPITNLKGKYGFLSNFHPCPVMWDGLVYPTVEHAYQAAKSLDPDVRKHIQQSPKAADARRIGKSTTLRPNWDECKLEVMLQLVRQKFSSEPLRSMLLDTGDAHIEEGNWWGDVYWGVYLGMGQNHLGKLLMQVRAEIRKQISGVESHEADQEPGR